MCGIAGLADCGGHDALLEMTRRLAHRGPDGSGTWEHEGGAGYAALGSRRLAILDLSERGHMPMGNEDGSVWLAYNGEVYNYRALRDRLEQSGCRFRSGTDTEVVLRLYERLGAACVAELDGMFAFAVCDLRQGGRPRLFLARDHLGVKPLYYARVGEGLAFASEIDALMAVPGLQPGIDPSALVKYLTFLWVPEPETIWQGITALPAGHTATFVAGELHVERYWDLDVPAAGEVPAGDEAVLAEEVRSRLASSVRDQLVSDVPVGAFLSGGLDSAGIVASVPESQGALSTFTVTFPAADRVGETTLDDPALARLVARRFGTKHQEMVVRPEVAELLPRLLRHTGQPVADPAIIMAYLVCEAARGDVTVLLSGMGGDEVFGGYRKYAAYRLAQYYRHLPAALRRRVLEPLLLRVPNLRGSRLKGYVRLAQKLARSGSLDDVEGFVENCRYNSRASLNALLAPDLRAELRGIDPAEQHYETFERVAHADFVNQMLYADVKLFMVGLNLLYTDRMSMATSVEVRVPYLARSLVEFAMQSVPPDLKVGRGLRPETKVVLRRALEPIVPHEVLTAPKAGFGGPIDTWLARDLRGLTDDLLGEESIAARGLFDPARVRRLREEHNAGVHDWSYQLWQLLAFEAWARTCAQPVSLA